MIRNRKPRIIQRRAKKTLKLKFAPLSDNRFAVKYGQWRWITEVYQEGLFKLLKKLTLIDFFTLVNQIRMIDFLPMDKIITVIHTTDEKFEGIDEWITITIQLSVMMTTHHPLSDENTSWEYGLSGIPGKSFGMTPYKEMSEKIEMMLKEYLAQFFSNE